MRSSLRMKEKKQFTIRKHTLNTIKVFFACLNKITICWLCLLFHFSRNYPNHGSLLTLLACSTCKLYRSHQIAPLLMNYVKWLLVVVSSMIKINITARGTISSAVLMIALITVGRGRLPPCIACATDNALSSHRTSLNSTVPRN